MTEHHSDPNHLSGAKDSEVVGTSQKVWGIFRTIFLILVLFFVLFRVKGCNDERRVQRAEKATARATAQQQVVNRPVVVRESPDSVRTFNLVSAPNNCAIVYLNNDVKFYPLGDSVVIQHIEGGPRYVSDPRLPTLQQRHGRMRVGWYTVCRPTGSAAPSVDILTKWSEPPR